MGDLVFPVTKARAKESGVEYSSEINRNAKFPSRLRDLRKDRGNSQSDLAKVLGVSKSTVGLWETGDTQPDAESVYKMASYYGVNTDYILCKSDIPSVDPNVISAAKTTGLNDDAVRRLALDAISDEKSPVLQAVELLLTTRSGKDFLRDLYTFAIANYDSFVCIDKDGKKIFVDKVFPSIGDKFRDEDELIAKNMGLSFMVHIQDDLFRLRDEAKDKHE